jgi:general stress protein 26
MQIGNDFLSIAGTASVSRDQTMIDELWNRYAEAWFEGGRDDPAVALLRVHADSAEYWKMDDPKPVALIKYAKAIVTGQQPDLGENRAVDL